jgi:uncharacterized membrane protein YedE/YeeE
MSLNDALKAAGERAAEEHQKLIRDRRIKYASDLYGYASAYDNAVVIAGYAAFFALWAGTAGDIDRFARLVTVGMMGISLMCYISWQFAQMLTRQKFEFEKVATFKFEQDAARFNEAWADIERRHENAQNQAMRFWPWFFLPSVALGMLAGLTLSYNALAVAFGWPQLTGRF